VRSGVPVYLAVCVARDKRQQQAAGWPKKVEEFFYRRQKLTLTTLASKK